MPGSVCVCVCVCVLSCLVVPDSVTARLLCPQNSPSQNAGVGCHFLLQGRISCVSCTGRQIHYHCATWQVYIHFIIKYTQQLMFTDGKNQRLIKSLKVALLFIVLSIVSVKTHVSLLY